MGVDNTGGEKEKGKTGREAEEFAEPLCRRGGIVEDSGGGGGSGGRRKRREVAAQATRDGVVTGLAGLVRATARAANQRPARAAALTRQAPGSPNID